MLSYAGPAQLVYPDKTVDLHRQLRNGVGSGSVPGPVNGGEARLRLPNGSEASVLISNVIGNASNQGIRFTVELALKGAD
jgi:hypothetical protein